MPNARAELVDDLPAGRNRALVRLGDEVILLVRKGAVDGPQTCEEMTELLQALVDNETGVDGIEWPPTPDVD